MSMSKQCVVKPLKQESSPLKQESSEGTTSTDTHTIIATQLPKIIPGLKDLAVGSDWKGCLELMKKYLGFRSDEYQQLQFANEYEEVLSKAAEKGFIDFIKLLLHNGFPVNTVVDKYGRTMLHLSILNNKINIVKLLLSYGADVNLTDSQGHSAIHFVAHYGYYDIAKILLQNSEKSSTQCRDVDARDKTGYSALHYAAQKGHYNIVGLLLEKQENMKAIDVDVRNKSGYSPLHLAAEKGHAKIVWQLIEEGANINARTTDRETPLILAAKNGRTEVVKTLLSNVYCDVDARDIKLLHCSALDWAKRKNHQSIVELLTNKK